MVAQIAAQTAAQIAPQQAAAVQKAARNTAISAGMDYTIHTTFHRMKEAAERRVAPAFVRKYAHDFDYVVWLAQSLCGYTPRDIQAAIRGRGCANEAN